ncbi:MAG: hypothetical protein AAF799_07560 [Myxococcota bacterium]
MRKLSLGLSAALAGLAIVAWPGDSVQAQPTTGSAAEFERMQGFATVVVNHINETLGTENLPVANGGGVEPGVFVTVKMDELLIFDQPVAKLQGGRSVDTTIAAECRSECPAAFYDPFQRSWLEAAVESTTFAVEIPQRVVLAVDRELPAATLLQVVYAAAETRPVQPPQLALLVNNTRGSLRAKTFFVLPPEGIELRQGSAALGLTIEVGPGSYEVKAADQGFARKNRVGAAAQLLPIIKGVKKRYPGKETVILVPKGDVTVRELMTVANTIAEEFPRLVLSAGQTVRI